MSSIELLLLDLLRLAETPLYSAFCWLGRQLGRDVSLAGFLRVVDDLLDAEVVRLWSVNPETGDRTELFSVPEGLIDEYESMGHEDPRYDPLGLSLSLGPQEQPGEPPAWEADLDFENQTVSITASPGREKDAITSLSNLYPDIAINITDEKIVDDSVRAVGQITIRVNG